MDEPTPQEIRDSIDETVKQFFDRHRDELKTYGDALQWLHEADYEVRRQEAGRLGYSAFSTDILWLISSFGPDSEIDFGPLTPKVKKPTPDYLPPEPEAKSEPEQPKKRRGRPKGRKKTGPTNALGEVIEIKEPIEEPPVEEPLIEESDVEDIVEETIEEQPQWKPPRRPRRRAGRIPPGALAEAE